ncbi:uncharacterized protein LOC131021218 [Salvia miltiorrhiza]|uniref:uncharacterized protein LOC131021218 n=1 Tax=Salvia miltiorrhiza TaxID=226208 RepID=UPI0025ACAD91|nr:uncharacterized protein LOC131021218 [Salvia miltiorrhiza]
MPLSSPHRPHISLHRSAICLPPSPLPFPTTICPLASLYRFSAPTTRYATSISFLQRFAPSAPARHQATTMIFGSRCLVQNRRSPAAVLHSPTPILTSTVNTQYNYERSTSGWIPINLDHDLLGLKLIDGWGPKHQGQTKTKVMPKH